jgi:tripartite-type tricarboxylate transporter receptor subunit TctC
MIRVATNCLGLMLAGMLFLVGAGVSSVAAEDDAGFFRGKQITMLVGFAPGGGVDLAARTIVAHLPRFIPGEPKFVVQNMEGAAGVTAANYLANRTKADGLTIAIPGRGWFIEAVMKTPGVLFDPLKLTYIGSSGPSNTTMWVRKDTNIGSFNEAKTYKSKLVFGSLGPGTNTGLVPTMFARRGYPFSVISGYVSTARVLLALEQGEVHAFFTPDESMAARQELVDNKVIIPILQTRQMIAGVPLLRDAVPADDRPMLGIVTAAEDFGLVIAAPPGVPAGRAKVLRDSFAKMANDERFRADAAKIGLSAGPVITGDALQTMMEQLIKTTGPEVIDSFRQLRGR